MKLEHVACDLCGESKYIERYRMPDAWLWLNQFQYPVVECLGCGLVYVNPRPTFEENSRFYPEGYHDNRNDESHRKRYELQYSFIKDIDPGRMLDIGCARGDWLNYVNGQWDGRGEFHGVDAFSDGVHGNSIKFHQCQLPEADLPDNYFDLITSWAVFEHLHTPSKYFEVVSKILKKGGRFIFLVTNAESCYGKYAYKEDIPRHLYHFSEKTLLRYASKHGLRVDHIYFDDRFWDGRGQGTFRFGFGKLVGATWERIYLRNLNLIQRAAMKMGGYMDKLIFASHWEARMRRSGIIVVVMEK